jgi:uncharacterized protein YggE
MKEKSIAIASVAALLILTLAAWAGNLPAGEQPATGNPGTVTVTGDAEIRVVPDEVVLTLGVETWDKNLDIAKRQNDEIVKRVLALAAEYDIPPEHVQTEYINIEPRYRDGYYEQRDFIGYFVRKTVVITLRDLDRFEGLLTDALEAGVNYVQGIQFRTTELRQHKDEARALAIQAAREKAEALAGELDQAIGAPTSIVEQQSGWWSPYSSWWGGYWSGSMAQNVIQEIGSNAAGGDGTLSPGQINVNARVTVTFELSQ